MMLFILFIIKCGSTLADPSVTLTVEGGVSLVGEHCPGTVRLFCVGVDLTSLRWKYNESNAIQHFLVDAVPSAPILLANPAFLSVQLTDISQFARLANISSTLTVDVEQLQRTMVSSISCGDVRTFKTLQIDPVVIHETTLSNPEISLVRIYYYSNMLQHLQVSWMKLQPACPEHMLESISYVADLTGFQSVQVDYSACGMTFCEANISDIIRPDGGEQEYQLTLLVTNTTNTITTEPYETVKRVANTSDDYFSIQHRFDHNSCQFSGVCVSPLNTSTVTFCSITYRNDSHQVLLQLNVNIGEQFTITTSNISYYEALIRINHSEVNEVYARNNFIVGPSSPEIVKVVLLFSNRGELRVIQVDWVNFASICDYGLIGYELRIAMEADVLSTEQIRSNDCMPTTCTISTLITSEYLANSLKISLVAANDGGRSTMEYISPIHQLSALYYRPSIHFLNCTALQINCFNGISNSTECICEYYEGDSLYQQPLSKQDLSSKSILRLQETTTLHYFILKWNISKTLELQEEFFYLVRHSCMQTESSNNVTSSSLSNTLIIAVASGVAGLVCIVCSPVLLSILVVAKRKRKSERNTTCASKEKNESESPSPVYEEVKMSQFKDIEVNFNTAYGHVSQQVYYSNPR